MNYAQDNDFYEEPEKKLSIKDIIAIVKRRKKPIMITAISVFFIVVIAVLFWPPTYRSTATILIEEQEVPRDLVRSTITSYAVQRIEEIKQRIMTINNIMSIVDRFGLYTEAERNRMTRTQIAQEFRDNVSIQPISAEVVDPQSGRPVQAVIAFSLSFKGSSPQIAQKVTNELVTLYLNENLRERSEQTASTSAFLAAEAAALSKRLQTLGKEISDFKEANKGSLPELYAFNLNIVDRSERERMDARSRIQELEKNRLELASQIAQMSPTAPRVLPSGEMVLGDADLLKALQSEFRTKSAIYRPDHPDLLRLTREIENLSGQTNATESKKEIAKQLDQSQDELAQLKLKYSVEHPEIIVMERTIENLKKDLANTNHVGNVEVIADNPAYVLLQTQLQKTDTEIETLKAREKSLQEKIVKYETFLTAAPSVEKDYNALFRDFEHTQLKYREINAKLMEADLASNLETERKGERFTLIQPPEIPEEPVSPNRIALGMLGIIFAVGAGIGSGALFESIDPGIYGEKALIATLAMAPLVCIPYMASSAEVKSNRQKMWIFLALIIVITALAILVFHNFVKPLDVTWYILMRKLGLH